MTEAAMSLKEEDFSEALRSYGGVNCKDVAQDPKLYKATFDLIKAAMQGRGVAGAAAIASYGSTAAKHSDASQATKQLASSTSATLSIMKTSLDMGNALRLTSPGAVLAYVGAATVQKVGTGLSLAGSDQERAKCLGAAMELAGAVTTTALVTPTGIGLWLTGASLVASSVNAYQACSPLMD